MIRIKSYLAFLDEEGVIDGLSPCESFELDELAPIDITLKALTARIEVYLEDPENTVILFGVDEDEETETLH